MHTDLSVGLYYGDMGIDFWDGAIWKREIEKHEVMCIFAFFFNIDVHSLVVDIYSILLIIFSFYWNV